MNDEFEILTDLLDWLERTEITVPCDLLARAHELGIITEDIKGDINE